MLYLQTRSECKLYMCFGLWQISRYGEVSWLPEKMCQTDWSNWSLKRKCKFVLITLWKKKIEVVCLKDLKTSFNQSMRGLRIYFITEPFSLLIKKFRNCLVLFLLSEEFSRLVYSWMLEDFPLGTMFFSFAIKRNVWNL